MLMFGETVLWPILPYNNIHMGKEQGAYIGSGQEGAYAPGFKFKRGGKFDEKEKE